MEKPVLKLTGKTLKGGWVVGENVTKKPEFSEGRFTETYVVTRKDETALLKALDLSIALHDPDPTKALIELSKSYSFETELLELCKSSKLSKIIRILDRGNLPPEPGDMVPVPYFVVEYAEKNIKAQIDLDSRFNTAWLLRILHSVTVGLVQLHKTGVAHTDLRPENIAEFNKDLQKLTELAMSDKKGTITPAKGVLTDIDPSYLTPEHLYGHVEDDWVHKSQAVDVYQLGNLVFFLFTQNTFNTWLFLQLDEINPDYRPEKWGGTYEEVLPYLVQAYDQAVWFLMAYVESDKLKKELDTVLRELCHPDPRERGHRKNIASTGSSLSLERYVSLFDRLAKAAKYELL